MRRFLPDLFTVLLVLTVALASVLPAQGVFAARFGVATNLAIALLFFLHGARLSSAVVVAGLLHWRLHLLILLTTFALFPLLGLALGFFPPSLLAPPLYHGILFLCVLPSTVQSSIAFTSTAGGNVPAALCAASTSNIAGMFLTPLLAGLLLSAGGNDAFSWEVLRNILLQLLAPFLLGQALQPWIGGWVRAHRRLLAPVDRGSILMIVYLAFSKAVVEGLWHTFSAGDLMAVVIANGLILALVLCFTMFGSRRLGFDRPDEVAITFCGSTKSLASGIPIANVLFAGQATGALLLPVMLFHQMQLMASAVIAQHYRHRASATEAEASSRHPRTV